MQEQDYSQIAEQHDAADFECLDTEILLEWLTQRYKLKRPYGYIGDSLVAVNPCQRLAIYSQEDNEKYTNLRVRSKQPPHIFWVADHVYQSMVESQDDQCVVVSGDSGAGKTESTKYILSHLVRRESTKSDLVERLERVNPLLELFGNAATVLNSNSSRFGKLVELEYESTGCLCAAKIECFILEKFRVTSRNRHEKNFHAFYAVFAGMPVHRLDALNLEANAAFYRILRSEDGSNDVFNSVEEQKKYKQYFIELEAMLRDVGFTKEEVDQLYKVVAAILLIANIEFDPDEDGNGHAVISEFSEDSLTKASDLLGLSGEEHDDFHEALTCVKSRAGGEEMIRNKSPRQANDGRDAVSRELYSSLFYGIIDKVNQKLLGGVQPQRNPSYHVEARNKCIRILDISGFENVAHNGFEQLLINAANERLHSYFLKHTFCREREEYEQEEVDLIHVNFNDNTPILDLIFKKPHGIFPLVDDQLSIPQSSDKTFLEAVLRYNSRNDKFVVSPSGTSQLLFGVKHYAGQVMYNVHGFLEKNSDTLPNNLKGAIEESSNIFVRDYFLLGSRATLSTTRGGRSSLRLRGGRNRSAIPTSFTNPSANRTTGRLTGRVTEHFKTSLDHMMTKLSTAKPVFVRCIKPNLVLKPNKFDGGLVRDQLLSSGLLEVATVRKAGYPIRISYIDFAERYASIIEDMRVEGGARDLSKAIVDEARITEHQFGKTKMFLKMYHKDDLEAIVAQKKADKEAAVKAAKEEERRRREEERRARNTLDSYPFESVKGSTVHDTFSESGVGTESTDPDSLGDIAEEDEEEEEENGELKRATSEDNLGDQPSYMAFRMTERDFEYNNDFEMKMRRACRFFLYIILSSIILTTGVSTVISVIWIAQAEPKAEDKSYTGTVTMLCQLFPVIVTWISCFIKSCFGRKEWPTIGTIIGISFVDALQCLGRSLFLYRVLPSVTSLEGVILSMAVLQVPGFFKILTHCFQKGKAHIDDLKTKRRKQVKFALVLIVYTFAFLVQLGAIPVLVFRDRIAPGGKPRTLADIWPVFAFAALTTIGWWENYFYGVFAFGNRDVHVGRFRRNIHRVRETTFIYSGLLQIVLITVLPQVWISEPVDVFKVLKQMFTDYGIMWFRESYIILHFSRFGILYINIVSTFVCTFSSSIACRLLLQKLAFALPLAIIPLGASVIAGLCIPVDKAMFWSNSDICNPSLFRFEPDMYVLYGVGFALWMSYLIFSNHIWQPDCERMAKLDRLFVFNHRDAVFPYQSLAMLRRQDTEMKKERLHKVKKEEEEETERPLVYICATMWHETRQEMVQLLKSLFRLDFDNCARKIAAKKFAADNNSMLKDNYDAEIHIIFDDAFMTHPESKQRVVNSYVQQLLDILPQAATSVAKGRMELNPFDKIITPYGGRLTLEMPGGTLFHVHMKDKEKIRHKKRWSQIMYLYYLLGHKLVGQEYRTVEDLIKDKLTSNKAQAKERKKRNTLRVRPFTSLLNNLPDEVVRKAENVFIMTLDGDVDFRPDAVRLLIDRMKKNKKVAAVCGRIHPIGDGPMVWYQQFEYAVGHWLQKAAEHVFGCVMCCPGCFSLFRGSALMDDNVMRMYATEPTEARHYVQYEQGEDRWLCTLLLQQGWKIDYCAGSDAFTYAPETFNDFYIQRRRWSPSTMANIMDLLGSWRTTIQMNDNISTLFMAYQFFLMTSSIVAPGTVVFMIAGSYNAVLGVNMWQGYLMSVLPVLAYILLCLKAKTSTQVRVAAVMSSVYAIVMMIVTVGTLINIVNEDFFTPNVLFLVGLSIVFVVTGLVHPKELMCLFHGILYYLTVPSTFVFLTVFFLCNLNVVSWGTREGPKKVDPAEEELQMQAAKKGKIRKFLDSLGIASLIEDVKSFMFQIIGSKDQRSTPLQGLTPQTSITNLNRVEAARPSRPVKKEKEKKVILDPTYWVKALDNDSNVSEPKYLEDKEVRFWKNIINEFLLPMKSNKEQQEKIKADLLSARNNVVFAYFLLNLMFTLVILQLQLKQDLLKETFFIAGKYEPVSVVFLASFTLLLMIQFYGSLAHQWGTFLHLIASTRINWFRANDDERKAVDAIKEAQKLQAPLVGADDLMPDYDDVDEDDDYSMSSSRRVSIADEEEPDYPSDDDEPAPHVSQYERNFQRNFRTVRRHLNHNTRYHPRPQIPTVSRNHRDYAFQRRQDLYRSVGRSRPREEYNNHAYMV
ncbi:uncharacterized protein LOC124134078 [Haliotis rufescens]|uniref:uncharacterized protein LOC124134078 n=1 Tax=Haliotis rufescens TaxID=6454 RepID=UPI00201EA1D0|nr:uncharacterized protein LOC124134078 [Haliotis rufescens]XP_048256021.1 uncharacterized protein LOC124134078 [Haliotis rufescens]